MSRKTKIVSLAAVAVLIAALAAVLLIFPSQRLEVKYFPEKLDFRVELREGETVRVVEYYPDGLTPMHAIADHKDGKETNYWYYETGKVKEARTLSAEDDGDRHLLRHAYIAEDGVTYKSDTEYDDQGNTTKETLLVANDLTERKVYFPSTTSLNKFVQLKKMDIGWVKSTETIYTEGGLIASLYNLLEDGSGATSVYSEDGSVTAVFTRDKYGVQYNENWLYPDGKTTRRAVDQNRSGTTLTTMREDGSMETKVHWAGPIDGGYLMYSSYDEKGTLRFEQSFMFKDGQYHIWSASVNREDGKSLRNIYFSQGSKLPTSEVVYDPADPAGQNRVFKMFDENGFLKETKTWTKTKSGEVKTFTPEDKLGITVPEEYLVFPTFEAPPQEIPYDPPQGPY